ncbi:30S ribosomal protein S2 [Candidatus Parcubacteria bacterium]|nr:MAG: 30S ribosomal protein S2 [Candidatus Parcubacteria bacterium]
MLMTEEKTQQTEEVEAQEAPVEVDSMVKEMFEAGMHLGYSVTSRNPKMEPFIFGLRNGVEIFDLEKTKNILNGAKEFVKKLGKEKKQILFVGTKKEAKEMTQKIAVELGMPYVKERWIGGTLTNIKQIRSRIDFLNDMKKKRDTGELEKYTKKERLDITRKIEKMETYFGGLAVTFKGLPAAVLVIDSKHEKIAVKEATQVGLPVIALLNTDCDPSLVSQPVPGNDNSLTSISYFLSEVSKAYKEGLAAAQEEVATGK